MARRSAFRSVDPIKPMLEAGIAAGGKAMEDPPGKRLVHGVNMFAAYLTDPDGNKLCALHNLNAE
jgi:predicted lactoylglutathione lyase